ncbi:MAG: GNAT family N-acetyltransferase [Pseudomonadota bacterium]
MGFRNATAADLDSVAAVHIKAFPGFFLTRLGRGFLCELYRGFLEHPDGIFLVAIDDQGGVTGFAAGTMAPDRFFSDLRRSRGVHFLFHAIPALLCSPSLVIAKLYSAVFYRGDKPADLDGGALLSSIGVQPEMLGKSLGKELLLQFESEAFTRGAPFVYLTTDEAGNDRVNAFYSRSGYVVESRFMQGGSRAMLRYLKQAHGMSWSVL